MTESQALPYDVGRERYCSETTTLEDCHALQLYFEPVGCADMTRYIIVWRENNKHTRPAEPGKRLRDLRPGDYVLYRGKRERLTRVDIYR